MEVDAEFIMKYYYDFNAKQDSVYEVHHLVYFILIIGR